MFLAWVFSLMLFEIKFTTKEWNLAAKSILMAMVLGWTYGLFSWIVLGWTLPTFIAYMSVDFTFQIIMATSNFLSILWIYPRIKNILIYLGETIRDK